MLGICKITDMYSEKFIKEVKECYPDSEKIHQLADEGSVLLGRYLDDSCGGGIPLDRVLTALTLEELQAEARLAKRKVNCYRMWCDEDPREKVVIFIAPNEL
jgi:hypothetical protein